MRKKQASPFIVRRRLIAIAISTCFSSTPAWANPTGPQVVNGSVAINQEGKLLTVTNSNGAIINWNTFSIAADEATRFNQASASSSVLNRVLANDPSVLLGALSSNGKVWLVNPAGIMVGAGARIDVAGFVASTLNVRNEDFLAGRLNFQATPNAGALVNNGQIATPSGGSVYLIAPEVTNKGIINAPNGEVLLAAGQTVQLVDTGTPGVKVEITGTEGSATNLGQIVSEAGRIGMAGVLVKNGGELNASSVVKEGGRIFLRASQHIEIDEAGRIHADGTKGGEIIAKTASEGKLAGELIARGSFSAKGNGSANSGGFVETSAANVRIDKGFYVDTGGGEWLIDPVDFTIASGSASQTTSGIGADTLSTSLGLGSVSIATDASTAGNGDILVNSTVSKTAGGDATLTLSAHGSIVLASNVAVSSVKGKLNVNLYADSDSSNGGAILLNSGSSIVSKGGNVTFAGGTGATGRAIGTASNRNGIILDGAIIDAGGGNVSLTGTGYSGIYSANGIFLTNSSYILTTGAGTIALDGNGGTGSGGSNYGVNIGSKSRIEGAAAVSITGQGGGNSSTNYGFGLYVNDAWVGSTGGSVSLSGTGGNGIYQNFGVYLDGGEGGGGPVMLSSTGGALTITGTGKGNGSSNYGIYARYATLDTSRGDGTSGGGVSLDGTGSKDGSNYNHGIYLTNTSIYASANLQAKGAAGPGGSSRDITLYDKVILRADSDGTGTGVVDFGGSGFGGLGSGHSNVDVEVSGGTNIYYNPTSYSDATTRSDSNGNPYSTVISGSGSYTAWMLVNDATHLQAMNTNLSGRYALGRNIDASATASWNSGLGFAPVGDSSSKFTGKLDGLKQVISGLTIARTATDVGLFGNVAYGGSVTNVGLTGASVTGSSNVGSLAGSNSGSISNSYAGGSVGNSSSSAVGGLVGYNGSQGSISNSYSSATVKGASNVGGLLGNNDGSLTYSYALGSVGSSSSSSVGGLVGRNGSTGSIDNTYSYGLVSGASDTGGLVGLNAYGGTVGNSVWGSDTSGQASSAGGTSLTTTQFMAAGSYSAWTSFSTNWWISEGYTRPFLRSEWSSTIHNAHELQLIAMTLGGNYKLANDIDMHAELGSGMWKASSKFVPIGSSSGFTGTFDGVKHTISSLVINRTDSNVGLFGYLYTGANVANVALTTGTSGSVTGGSYVGALAGLSYQARISNSSSTLAVAGNEKIGGLLGKLEGGKISLSHATGNVTGDSGNYVGGLVGLAESGFEIYDSYATGTVTSCGSSCGDFVGGLLGYANIALDTIARSYATGNVTGNNYVGGLVGHNNRVTIHDSYATGNVTGEMYVGGLVGNNSGAIDRTFSSGAVTSTSYGGRLIGYNDSTYGGVKGSFWDASVAGAGIGGGVTTGASGITAAAMKQAATFNDWSISSTGGSAATWRIYEGATTPLLRNFLKPLTVTANNASKTYDKVAFAGNGTSLSLADATTLGSATYSGAATMAFNVGSYAFNVSGLYSNQQGYDISYASGTLTISPRALSVTATAANKVYDATTSAVVTLGDNRVSGDVLSLAYAANFSDKNVGTAKTVTVSGITLTGADAGNYSFNTSAATAANIAVRPLSTWIGGATGNWSIASNWDALPDLSNVLAVTIPTGKTVTYDAAAGTTNLASLTAAGLSIAGGSLNIVNSLTISSSFSQTGGTLGNFAAGSSASITQASGNLALPAITVASLSLFAPTGAISQSGRIATLSLNTQSQGATTLTNPDNQIGGRVDMTAGGLLKLWASGDLNLGAINAGSNAVEIKAGGAILQALGTDASTNIFAGSADLASIFGGKSGGLAISANTQLTGALSATVGSGANFGGIRFKNTGAQPVSVVLVDNALAGAGVSFLNTGNIDSTSGYTLTTLNGGDLALLSNGNISWDGGTLSTPSGSMLMSADGSIAVKGALSSPVDLALSSTSSISVGVGGSVSTGGTGTAAFTAPSVNINGSVSAADDVGIIADAIILGSGSRTNAGHDVIFAASNLTATNSAVSAGHDISAAVTGDLRLNGSSFTAGHDIFINMLGPTSTLYLNDTTGLPPAFLWAQAPSTVNLSFPARASGGLVVDGLAVDPLNFVTVPGSSGLFYGAAKVPATFGAGLKLAYSTGTPDANITPPPTATPPTVANLFDAVLAAVNATSTPISRPFGTPVGTGGGLGPQAKLGGTLDSGGIGGTEGTFGGSSDEKGDHKDEDKDKTDKATGLKKQDDKPTTKKLSTCS